MNLGTLMKNENGWRVFLGSFLLLILSYIIYFFRYPMWSFFSNAEPIFVFSFLSYFIIFVSALLLLKKDSQQSLSPVFKNKGTSMIFMGLIFALLYLGLWYLISFGLGSSIEFGSFPSLIGFESYAVFSLPLAFVLYLAFSLFGAFAEEVAYRGYVQTRISSRFGNLVGILTSTLFFSLQHIHIFQSDWLFQFLQNQLFHVILFGIFVGYLFLKNKENIWSAFAFHGLLNAFSVTVPIFVTHSLPYTFYVAETISFATLILLLHYLPLTNKKFS
jgi:membrane protease YdiL (CAAX protease family)